MLHNEERPRNVWNEQLALAEAIGAPDSPLLIPEDFESSRYVWIMCGVLAEDGLVWNMRIMNDGPLGRKCGYSEAASAAALAKVAKVLALLDRRLQSQAEQGSKYLVGSAVSAADIYWATMSMCVTATHLI